MDPKASRILTKADIVKIIGSYIKLERAGDNYRAKCPFHGDKDPSLSVSPKLNIFKCFGVSCEAGGNVATFISLYEDVTYNEALAVLAKKLGHPEWVPEFEAREFKNIYDINEFVLKLYQDILFNKTPISERARLYLKERRITQETASLFGLGYSTNTWK